MAHIPYYWLALVPLLYLRIRRSLGFRRFSGRRLLIPIALFGFLIAMVLVANAHHPMGWLAAAAGGIFGGGLGALAIRKTEFQNRQEGLYYRTHVWIQASVLALFLMRMTYRLTDLFVAGVPGPQASPLQAFQDPLTAGVVSMLMIYNLTYFVFVFRKGGRLAQAHPGTAQIQPNTR